MNWEKFDTDNFTGFGKDHPAYENLCLLTMAVLTSSGVEFGMVMRDPGYFDGLTWRVWDQRRLEYNPVDYVTHYMLIERPDGKTIRKDDKK